MKSTAYHFLRIGLGLTFLLIGWQIWQSPESWASFLQPWATNFVPGDVVTAMKGTAFLDIIIGAWLIVGLRTWIPALLGALHLLVVLITTTASFEVMIVRDIGLLGASIALFWDAKMYR